LARGRWYEVGPVSLGQLAQLAGMLTELGVAPAPVGGLPALPAEMLRVLAPLLVSGEIRERDLRRATPVQLVTLAVAWAEVNDWARLQTVMSAPTAGGSADERGFDRTLCAVGSEFGLWPYEVTRLPWVEVDAVIDYLERRAGGSGAVSEDTAARVKQLSAAREATRA